MKVYVAGPVTDVATVRQVQRSVTGHELTLDWSRDVSFTANFAGPADRAAAMAAEELDAVLKADAVLVIASEHDGRGMFVELGAALTRGERGELDHLAVIGNIKHESVFYCHPLVQRCATVGEWLATLH